MGDVKKLQDIANILRRDVLRITSEAGSGHPTTCMSCAELMSVLFFDEMSYDVEDAFNPNNDEFILSKGHGAPILYSVLFRAGALLHDPITLRKLTSPIEGHPVPSVHVPHVKVATGSLGQGLNVGVGMALAAKMQKRKFRTYVLLGDSEMAEGSVYEALELGAHYKLNNLIAIVDVNRLGQTGQTMLGHDIKGYEKKIQGFGWETIVVDGHKVKQVLGAFSKAKKSKKPVAIIAKTFKGRGVSFLENKEGLHGKAVPKDDLGKAFREIPDVKVDFDKIKIKKPRKKKVSSKLGKVKFTNYKIGEEAATRDAYGSVLANLAIKDKNVIAIDAEVSNSTKSGKVKEKTPKQFVEAYIAEQNMVGMALGLSKKNYNVFASSFSAFLSRAHDQIRMAALSLPDLTFCGSHCGVSIGEDGGSQMGLEDLAMFRSLPYSFVFYPSDAVSCERLTDICYRQKGLKYIRTTRGKTPVIYKGNAKFKVGDFNVLKQSGKDKVVLVGSGITLHECLKAHEELKRKGVNSAVVDLYCVQPFNSRKFIDFVKKHGSRVVVSEDHYPEGGIGEMLASILVGKGIKMEHLAANGIPHSGKPEELLDKFGISSKWIVKAV